MRLRRQDDMTDEQLEKFVKERYEERTAFEVRRFDQGKASHLCSHIRALFQVCTCSRVDRYCSRVYACAASLQYARECSQPVQ